MVRLCWVFFCLLFSVLGLCLIFRAIFRCTVINLLINIQFLSAFFVALRLRCIMPNNYEFGYVL